jgi:SAM-dependent methyltransferase
VLAQEIGKFVNRGLRRFGLRVGRLNDAPAQVCDELLQAATVDYGSLPPGANEYLFSNNPRLLELRDRYQGHPATKHSLWRDSYLKEDLDLRSFRGDNAYIWQTRKTNEDPLLPYVMTTYHAKEIDRLNLLASLEEDGQFGAVTFTINDTKVVSRDLLDSVCEINFLDRHLGLSKMHNPVMLDVGAGYGRLAYRLLSGLPNVKHVYCVDGVPESTFLCEYYLKFRGADSRATAVPIDSLNHVLEGRTIDIATNIESFTECTFDTIAWWVALIKKLRVKYLMIIPDFRNRLLSREVDHSKRDFMPLLQQEGFELLVSEPFYGSATSLAKYALYPDRAMLLFKNRHVTT